MANLELTVEMLERDLMRAVQSRDRARLDELIAPDCELTGSDSNGERVGKHAYVAAALDPAQVTLDEFRFEDLATTTETAGRRHRARHARRDAAGSAVADQR